jgi:hypothetical protein
MFSSGIAEYPEPALTLLLELSMTAPDLRGVPLRDLGTQKYPWRDCWALRPAVVSRTR